MINNNYLMVGIQTVFALIALVATIVVTTYNIEQLFFSCLDQQACHSKVSDHIERFNPWTIINVENKR